MGTTLTGQTQSSTYDALLKITDNGPVGGALKTVTDGLGNDSALQVSTAGIASTGTLAVTGATTLAALTAGATTVTTLGASGLSSFANDIILTRAGTNYIYYNSDFQIAKNGTGPAMTVDVNRKATFIAIENSPIGATTPSTVAATTITSTGSISANVATAFGAINVNAAAGTERSYSIKTSGNTRWYWGASNSAEGGANAGSDFFIASANDAGAFLALPFSIVRSTGVVTIGTLTVTNGVTAASLADAKGDVRLIPQNSQSGPYTLVLADAGKHVLHPSADVTARTFTIPANASVAYAIGTAITFINQNGAGIVTIAITTDTMRLAGTGTTGNRSLAANGVCTAVKITATEWIISGTGLT